ncbi:RNA polymerase sigma-70 factor (ECF subfamily) [Caulobacter ginsengisoli]|uniref:RNA polymerase sigma-70 factor (ECF subfamily) n=1 Tax=Caulobacter ginsengisoli TaxID=400775 RepID=A0ABU0IWH7_9CAUL|nr:sigma-70 family RNA polymerase sigma factor [Caulobacter ginsengisoli]MDQ0466376.1 RNA polymerase sigma-70 factor (ECF subfamily) [Caulobacter ginsengisoli]
MADGSLEPEAFERMLADLRPKLHRYCARMVGSAIEGEDVVQDAMVKAAQAFPAAGDIGRPDAWLFRIAHNTALDALRSRKRRPTAELTVEPAGPADAAESRVAVASSLAVLMALPVSQRAAVVLMDVLGHSNDEAVEILGVTAAAAKAALHRGRERLKTLKSEPAAPRLDPTERSRLQAYADRFNARDFDALRALLAEEVRLDLAGRLRLDGKAPVSVYFTRYSESHDWWSQPGLVDGRPALLISDPADPGRITYVVLLDWQDGEIARIRDYRYATYVLESMDLTRL